jgi:hypothetical protein
MSIFDHYILRKFYRLVKNYTEDLLRDKVEDVEDKVDKIDSRMSRTKLLRREWNKVVKTIRDWNAVRIKKEVKELVRRAQGHRNSPDQVREDLDDFLMLARYKYLEAINPKADVEDVDIGPANLDTFLSYYLEKLMRDDMVTSRQFLNSSVSDRNTVIRSCMTDSIEESIPASIHREILNKKSRRKKKEPKEETHETKKEPKEKPSMQPPNPPSSKEPKEEEEKEEKEEKKPRKRRVKEVVLEKGEQDQDEDEEDGPSQMDILRGRLAALEERDRKMKAGTYRASGKDCDFELNTNLSSFM